MDTITIKKELEKRLKHSSRIFTYDRENEQLRIENIRTGKGITVSLPGIVGKWHEQKDKAIEEVVYYVEQGLQAMGDKISLSGLESKLYPVIRSTSFPSEAKENVPFIFDDHTAETRIYYAVDLGKTYRLIDEELLSNENWTRDRLRETALFNLRALPISLKEDVVAGNKYFFVRSNDGYDASRILNQVFLKEMKEKTTGTFVLAVPHQDVLILADIQNETGYDILAQMTMSFFAAGHVPITALSFLYENDELEPIFILGKNKNHKK